MRADYYTDFQWNVLHTMRDLKKYGQNEVEISEIANMLGTSTSRVGHALGVISCRQNFPIRVYRASGEQRREACSIRGRRKKIKRSCSCRLN